MIFNAAGPQIQYEANQNHPNALNHFEFVATSGGNLAANGVQRILHASLPQWPNDLQSQKNNLAVCGAGHLKYSEIVLYLIKYA